MTGSHLFYDAMAEAIRIELYGEEYCKATTEKGRERAYTKRCRSVCKRFCGAGQCANWAEHRIVNDDAPRIEGAPE